ncbi:resolvase family site-specific recombinase [Enterococcus hirae]|uniref:recombinase family protein n=1 Tax=Enterococcus hirae TaxID=1354 RepID=UPI00102853B5|nr:recombinase family protein [Enterococcus hirae]VFA57538.1 resolvase family site-specific recombinase [Enterococcus hirae]VTS66975.1 resolvase family site-specific recombinase [Enterococcus hirae]
MKKNDSGKEKKVTEQQKKIQEAFNYKREVEVIPAKISDSYIQKKRVAAYCRVSTYAEAQSGSFELQIQSYKEKIMMNPNWKLVDIYADRGASGTTIKKREHFNRMLNDCRLNKIDLIIVKSISRFSRNTLDFITIYRELKALSNPVGVFIEDLNLNTLDATSETMLLMLSVVAQAESEQKSEAITWSIIERFKKGLPIIPTHNFLGFTKDKFGKVVVEESEAEIVRFIYKNFLEGIRAVDIASLLNEANISTVAGNKWKSSSIYRVLRNEKYFGLVIMQKTFTVDCFTHKKKINRGEKPQYLLRNGLPAIISEEDWNSAQKLLTNPQKGIRKKETKNIEKPKSFVSSIKSGVFKGFIVIDTKWTKEEVAEVLSKGEH